MQATRKNTPAVSIADTRTAPVRFEWDEPEILPPQQSLAISPQIYQGASTAIPHWQCAMRRWRRDIQRDSGHQQDDSSRSWKMWAGEDKRGWESEPNGPHSWRCCHSRWACHQSEKDRWRKRQTITARQEPGRPWLLTRKDRSSASCQLFCVRPTGQA